MMAFLEPAHLYSWLDSRVLILAAIFKYPNILVVQMTAFSTISFDFPVFPYHSFSSIYSVSTFNSSAPAICAVEEKPASPCETVTRLWASTIWKVISRPWIFIKIASHLISFWMADNNVLLAKQLHDDTYLLRNMLKPASSSKLFFLSRDWSSACWWFVSIFSICYELYFSFINVKMFKEW